MQKHITVGIIGAGRIGKLHAENITYHVPGVKIKTVSDIYCDSIRDWAHNLGIENVSSDYRDIVNDPDIDAVLICSSTDTHSEFIIKAAKSRKHVFCEKPVDLDVSRIKKVLEEVEKAGIKFQVGFNRRFDHNFKRVHDLVKEGKIGTPHVIKITSRDPEPPPVDYVKVSGGIFLDMTIHDFDMARYLSGSEVTEVFARGAVLVDQSIGDAGDVDTAIVTLKFENGALGVIDNSRKAVYGYDQRVEVFGSEGCITVSNDTPNTAVLSNAEGVTGEKPKYFFLERYKDSYIDEVISFFDAIRTGGETPVTGIDGLKPVIIGLAAKKSLLENRPVKTSEIY